MGFLKETLGAFLMKGICAQALLWSSEVTPSSSKGNPSDWHLETNGKALQGLTAQQMILYAASYVRDLISKLRGGRSRHPSHKLAPDNAAQFASLPSGRGMR